MMPLQEYLMLRGYKKSESYSYMEFKTTRTLFQKLIKNDKGKKYHINLWCYAESRYGHTNPPESIRAEVQFETDGVTDECMDVTLFTRDVDKIEEVFENMWQKLGLNYYELWSEQ